MKPRILVCTDDARISTGFSRVAREVLTRLHKKNKYEIFQQGWFSNKLTHEVPFTVYPTLKVVGKPGDARHHGVAVADMYGEKTFDELVLRIRPKIVLGIGNIEMLGAIIKSSLKSTFRSIIYHPVDGFPTSAVWKEAYDRVDRVVAYTDWGRDVTERWTGVRADNVIPHGVNLDTYHPLSPSMRDAVREKILGDQDSFAIGFAGRNLERKRIDLVIQTAAILIHGWFGYHHNKPRAYPLDKTGVPRKPSKWRAGRPQDMKLVLHTPGNDNMGFNLEPTIRLFNMGGRIICDRSYKVAEGCSDDSLRNLYSCMDVFLSFAPEGWGLCIGEAQACGVPLVLGNWSAPAEWAESFHPIKNHGWGADVHSGLLRPFPDIDTAIQGILKIKEDKKYRKKLIEGGLKRAKELNWDAVADKWSLLLDEELALAPKNDLIHI